MKQKILILLMALFSLPSFAQDVAGTEDFYYEYEGQTVGYKIVDKNLKTVETAPIKRVFFPGMGDVAINAPGNRVSGKLVIPSTVSDGLSEYTVIGIGEYSFGDNEISSLTLPSSITTVGSRAFEGCANIKDIKIEDGESKIDFGAFSFSGVNASSLYIGRSVTNLYLDTIKSLVIGGNEISIENSNFGDNLDSVHST